MVFRSLCFQLGAFAFVLVSYLGITVFHMIHQAPLQYKPSVLLDHSTQLYLLYAKCYDILCPANRLDEVYYMGKGFPALVRAAKLLNAPEGATAISALLYNTSMTDPTLVLAGNFIAVDDYYEAHQIRLSLQNKLVSKGLWEEGKPIGIHKFDTSRASIIAYWPFSEDFHSLGIAFGLACGLPTFFGHGILNLRERPIVTSLVYIAVLSLFLPISHFFIQVLKTTCRRPRSSIWERLAKANIFGLAVETRAACNPRFWKGP